MMLMGSSSWHCWKTELRGYSKVTILISEKGDKEINRCPQPNYN
jgi:hypothetical protein